MLYFFGAPPFGDVRSAFNASGHRLLATFAPRSTLRGTAAEVVIGDVLGLDAEVVEHVDDGAAHGAGAAHVVLYVLGGGVVLEVGVVHDLVDEAGGVGHAGGVGGRIFVALPRGALSERCACRCVDRCRRGGLLLLCGSAPQREYPLDAERCCCTVVQV